MRIKLYAFLSLLVAMAVPYLMFAVGDPSILSFRYTGSFVPGAAYSVRLGNVPDLSTIKTFVSLNGVLLNVTSTTADTLQGTLPNGISAKGNLIKVDFGSQSVQGYVAIPYVTSHFMPKVEKGAQLNISGNNFADAGCSLGIAGSSLTVSKSSQNLIIATLGDTFNGGDLTVTCDGLTSAPYVLDYQAPHIDFAENKDGIVPGGTLTLHVKGLSSVPTENRVFLDNTLLDIVSQKLTDGLLSIRLPAENAKGSLKLTVNDLESNVLALDANLPPILIDSNFTEDATVMNVKVTGKYFSSDPSKAALSIGGKKGTVKFANATRIEAEFPRGPYAGCLMVEIYGQVSNCLPFNTTLHPFLKGFEDPRFLGDENKFEWTLFAENLSEKNDTISVYVNGEKAELKSRMLNRLNVTFDQTPDTGEVYVVSDGLESNRVPYNFGVRFYPFIRATISGGRFMYSQLVTLQGNNLGQELFKNNTTINLSGVELMRDEKTQEPEWKVSPSEITLRLNNKVKPRTKATLSVTVKGKQSNEVTFVTGQKNTQSLCSPWIQAVQYPEGISEGSVIRILGQCFNPDPTKNWIAFDTIFAKATLAKSNVLEAKIPKGAKPKGKLTVKTAISTSNAVDYVSADKTTTPFLFSFEDLGNKANFEIGTEGPFAKLQIKNTLGEIEMQTLKFKLVYEDDKNNPNSVLKLGSLPFGEVKVAFSGLGKKNFLPLVIQRDGANTYTYRFELDGIRILPSTETQSLEFRTTVMPFALNGAKFHLEFDPSEPEQFSALHIQRDKQSLLKITQKGISSPILSISKTALSCIDTDEKKSNCDKFLGKTALVILSETAPTIKPKLPKIPQKPYSRRSRAM